VIRALLVLSLVGCAHQAAGPTPREHELEQQLAATQAELAKARAAQCTASEAEANQRAVEAIKAAQEALELVAKLERDLEELDKKVATAIDTVVAAQNDADRAAAKARLVELQKQKYEMERRIEAAKQAK
jgi:hypothetical protein